MIFFALWLLLWTGWSVIISCHTFRSALVNLVLVSIDLMCASLLHVAMHLLSDKFLLKLSFEICAL
jgi:hypothetical protein